MRKDARTLRPITAGQFAVLHTSKKKQIFVLFIRFFLLLRFVFRDARTNNFALFARRESNEIHRSVDKCN